MKEPLKKDSLLLYQVVIMTDYIRQPDVTIRQPDKIMYRKSKKLFDEIKDE